MEVSATSIWTCNIKKRTILDKYPNPCALTLLNLLDAFYIFGILLLSLEEVTSLSYLGYLIDNYYRSEKQIKKIEGWSNKKCTNQKEITVTSRELNNTLNKIIICVYYIHTCMYVRTCLCECVCARTYAQLSSPFYLFDQLSFHS